MKTIKRILCAIFGHPRISTVCFGYVSCARCSAQIGDTLAGAYDLSHDILQGHDCPQCNKIYRSLKWHEKLMVKK